MNKPFLLIAFLLFATGSFAQVIGRVDRKTKEFTIAANQKVDYIVYGYQFANATTQRLICFASNQDVVRANVNDKLGAYFDTFSMPAGDKIMYLGVAGTFGKMSFMTGGGAKITFYLPRSSFTIK